MDSVVKPVEVELNLGGRRILVQTGQVARQAHGSAVVKEGKAFVLATVVAGPGPELDESMVPLTVEYRERMSAAGRIPGAHGRREGRASERETLMSRVIDRSLRPLIPACTGVSIHLSVIVLGVEPTTDLDTLALLAASSALHLSDIPFKGPLAGACVARVKSKMVVCPSPAAREESDLDLVVSHARSGVIMVEGRASLVSENDVLDAIDAATAALEPALDLLDGLRVQAGKPKRTLPAPSDLGHVVRELEELVGTDVDHALEHLDKIPRRAGLAAALDVARTTLTQQGTTPAQVERAFDLVLRKRARANTLAGKRIGGRKNHEVRPVWAEVGLLGSNHGSALFCRGNTQALVSTTLGSAGDAARVETLAGNDTQRFMLHYNFPPWSVGEAHAHHGPGRREIGHGNLAQRALEAVLPSEGETPFTIRVVSDITESDGSSSMATVCGGCLALMDAGVKVTSPVAGIAMGLIREGDAFAILSDICGDEDHVGDMDFKVAGSPDGVSAIQLDNAGGGLTRDLLERALTQAREGRKHILSIMAEVLPAPRGEAGAHTPHTAQLNVDPSRVGVIIGKGGASIRELQKSTGTRIDIRDDGRVQIMGKDPESVQAAVSRIRDLSLELREGGVYSAVIDEIKDYGAFVRIGDHRGLVHISEWEDPQPKSLEGRAQKGQQTRVQLVSVNNRGQLVLSRRAALAADGQNSSGASAG